MNERVWAFLRGTEDANPGDYVLALVAVVGCMAALFVRMVA